MGLLHPPFSSGPNQPLNTQPPKMPMPTDGSLVWIQKKHVKTNQAIFNLAYVLQLKNVQHARTGPTPMSANPFQGRRHAANIIILRYRDNVRTPVVGSAIINRMNTTS